MTQLFTLEVETKQLKIIRSQTYLQHLSQVICLVAKEANLRMTEYYKCSPIAHDIKDHRTVYTTL